MENTTVRAVASTTTSILAAILPCAAHDKHLSSIFLPGTARCRLSAQKSECKDKKLKNLYYVGGTVRPGGGMPLAAKSGINTAKMLLRDES